MNPGEKAGLVLLAGNSHPELTKQISEKLCERVGISNVYHKSNRETVVDIQESVRGKDVYIIQTGTKNVNNDIMELLIMSYACKTSSCRKIIGVVPYLPYCKQSKMRKRGAIACKLLAQMFKNAGITNLITIDLHQKEIQGFFDMPVDNLRASPFLIEYIMKMIPDYRNAIIVARNANSVKRATSYAERLRLGIAVVHGEERIPDSDLDDGRHSPPPQEEEEENRLSRGIEIMPMLTPKAKPPMNVVGDVAGKIAIMVDDMIDDVEAFVATAELLKSRGAYKIYVMATHGLLSSDAPRLLEASPIDEVVVSNTVPHDIQKMQCHKIKTVDISVLLVEAIRRTHNNESMSYLFKYITSED
ncbi:phosphoribosyl pyrophosphate synthase-associated protein 2 [Lingula anatina]|uniref:Phosphoribosyl pyrophosphate synthase-associated protein 2 n=1 Tax=Lingula anatina TaxID=7574 RepID=A0A1S3J5R0_LINAN|nr:phosphoribosyl pyrophosphate synthase-associated protein 2-like [Lingula anatina]XP_013407649.1 phosphoribosyl pyrophosphate synthase-associated protein 2 [Lingula anatina]|eukprot:XP_013405757.1 phosphoribosyl pyrophosphate synthase-associated protein 2-like [Lingula anatina]